VAQLGSEHLDVNLIDQSSLRFHGAKPSSIQVTDVNNDGIPDLLLGFPSANSPGHKITAKGCLQIATGAMRGTC
jgi:FG-GAP repeat